MDGGVKGVLVKETSKLLASLWVAPRAANHTEVGFGKAGDVGGVLARGLSKQLLKRGVIHAVLDVVNRQTARVGGRHQHGWDSAGESAQLGANLRHFVVVFLLLLCLFFFYHRVVRQILTHRRFKPASRLWSSDFGVHVIRRHLHSQRALLFAHRLKATVARGISLFIHRERLVYHAHVLSHNVCLRDILVVLGHVGGGLDAREELVVVAAVNTVAQEVGAVDRNALLGLVVALGVVLHALRSVD